MNEAASGVSGFALFTALTQFLLAAGGAYMYLRWQKARRQCEQLLQEKEVIFGFVHDVGEAFAETEIVDRDMLLKRVLFYALRTCKASAGAIYIVDRETDLLEVRALSGIFPPVTEAIRGGLDATVSRSKHVENMVRARSICRGEGLVGHVADVGGPMLIADALLDPRVPAHEVDYLKIHSILLVPMRFHQEVLGVLVVVNRVDGLSFTQTDQNLLQALADQASASVHYSGLRDTLDDKKRIDHDLDVARTIQASLLPKELPHLPNFEIAAFNEPAQQIGGDYYDVVPIDDRHVGIAIADVSGKGIGGAMLMSVCRSIVRAQAPGQFSPAEVLRSVNRVMSRDIGNDMFVTMLYMVLHLDTSELVVARAGHERPLLISREGAVRPIDSPGAAIGMVDGETFDRILGETAVTLARGDVLVTYTDGITEAMNARGDEWGLQSLIDACVIAAAEGANSVLSNARQRLTRFVGSQPQYDDMTLLALRKTV